MKHIAKEWSNVQALHLTSVTSVALPVYQMLPAEQNTKITVEACYCASSVAFINPVLLSTGTVL